MKRFKSKKKKNYLLIYVIIFFISIILSILYISKKALVNEDSVVDFIINSNLVNTNKNV